MSSIDADVNIILNAQDKASPEVDAAAKRINRSFRDLRNQQLAVERSFTLQNRTLVQTLRTIQSVGQVVHRMIGLYNTWTLTQIRLQDSTRNLRDAQIGVNEAAARFGEGSPEHLDALKREKDATDEAKRAADDAKLGYALMATQFVTDATLIVTNVIPKLKALRGALLGVSAASAAVGGASAVAAGTTAASGAAAGAGATAASRTKTLGGLARGAVRIAGPVGLAVGVASLFGEQQAGETEIPSGFDAIADIAKDITNQVTQVFNFNGIISDDLPNKIAEQAKRALTFGG